MMAGGKKIAGITPASPGGGAATLSKSGEGRISYYHTDVLGSVVAVTDERGKLVEGNVYGPFGELEFSYKGGVDPKNDKYGLSTNRYMYTGQEQDAPGGLMYYGARWYDSETGRFISEDPAAATPEDPLSINRYIYCRNNPLIYTDPTGALFTEMLSFLGPLGTFFGGLIDAYLINKVVEVAVVAISNDMAKNGNLSGAKALMTGYQIFTAYQLVTSVCDLFSSISKTGDGQDLLKNHEELKRRGVGLDGVKFDVNGGNVSMIDIAAKNEEFARKMGNQVGWTYEWGASREGAVDCWGGIRYSLREMGYNISDNMTLTDFINQYTYSASSVNKGTLTVFDWNEKWQINPLGQWDHVVTNISAKDIIQAGTKTGVVNQPFNDLWGWAEERTHALDVKQVNWMEMEKMR